MEQTKGHVERLDLVFERLDASGGGHKCEGMVGLLKEGSELLSMDMAEAVRDAAIIGACQRVEHYEIAGYGTARAYAHELGENEIADILQSTLDEEGDADKKLQALALDHINADAMSAAE